MAGAGRARAGATVLLGAEEVGLVGRGMGWMSVRNLLCQLLYQLFHAGHHAQNGQE